MLSNLARPPVNAARAGDLVAAAALFIETMGAQRPVRIHGVAIFAVMFIAFTAVSACVIVRTFSAHRIAARSGASQPISAIFALVSLTDTATSRKGALCTLTQITILAVIHIHAILT